MGEEHGERRLGIRQRVARHEKTVAVPSMTSKVDSCILPGGIPSFHLYPSPRFSVPAQCGSEEGTGRERSSNLGAPSVRSEASRRSPAEGLALSLGWHTLHRRVLVLIDDEGPEIRRTWRGSRCTLSIYLGLHSIIALLILLRANGTRIRLGFYTGSRMGSYAQPGGHVHIGYRKTRDRDRLDEWRIPDYRPTPIEAGRD